MPTDIMDHPDSPDLETLSEFLVEPVAVEEIERRRGEGAVLLEDNVLEREDLDVRVPLRRREEDREASQDIGTYLYRLTQLFGSPQVPEYHAGEDISWRTNITWKYLVRITAPDDVDLPASWLCTIFDWKVGLGVAVATWGDADDPVPTADAELALASLRLIHNIGTEPVDCEFEGLWY